MAPHFDNPKASFQQCGNNHNGERHRGQVTRKNFSQTIELVFGVKLNAEQQRLIFDTMDRRGKKVFFFNYSYFSKNKNLTNQFTHKFDSVFTCENTNHNNDNILFLFSA